MSSIPHADTCTCETCVRTVVFGALRRAAEAARREDAAHERYEAKYGASFTSEHKRVAYAIRQTIRNALKADA